MRTRQDWERWLQDGERVQWLPASEVGHRTPLACIDGRMEGHRLGAPGGTAGELVLLVTVLELQTGERFGAEPIARVVRAWSERIGPIHLHSDTDAVQRAAARLDIGAEELRKWIQGPPADRRARLLEVLLEPEHVGCGHLRQMLERPEAYRVRAALVRDVIAAVYQRLWEASDAVEYRELRGAHGEQALLVFRGTATATEDERIPMLAGGVDDPQAFVVHPPALRRLRARGVELVREVCPELPSVDPVESKLALHRLGERHLEQTLQRLAPGLPRHRVVAEGTELRLAGGEG